MDERRATIDGVPMRWLAAGSEGPPVVFLHGIPTSPLLWRKVVPLIEGVRSFAWEMVGYGGSWEEAERRDISVRAQASYLREWLAAQQLEDVLLVGHDLGGGVAQIAAVAERERFSGLVLVNSICYDSWPIPSVKALRAAGDLVSKAPPSVFRAVFSSFLRRGHDDQQIATDSIHEHWPHYDHREGPRAFVHQVRSLNVNDTLAISADLPALDLPAGVVWGDADRFQKVSYGHKLGRDLGTAVDRIPGGKHFVPEDHPERVAAAVRSVLAPGG